MDLLACAYRNGSDRMVIVRCEGHNEFYLERVVFPFELLSFECPPQAELEIWTHGLGGAELIDRVPVHELLIDSPSSPAHLELVDNLSAQDDCGSILDGFSPVLAEFSPVQAAAG